jgi:hypothetical protein
VSQEIPCYHGTVTFIDTLKKPATSNHSKFTVHKSLLSWSRVLLEKLIIAELVKKFPAFYITARFITVFTRARYWLLS